MLSRTLIARASRLTPFIAHRFNPSAGLATDAAAEAAAAAQMQAMLDELPEIFDTGPWRP